MDWKGEHLAMKNKDCQLERGWFKKTGVLLSNPKPCVGEFLLTFYNQWNSKRVRNGNDGKR